MGYSIKEVAEVLKKKEQQMRDNACAIVNISESMGEINQAAQRAALQGIIQYLQEKLDGE